MNQYIYIIYIYNICPCFFLMQQVLEHTRTILQWMEIWKTIGAKLSGSATTPPDGYLSHGQGRSRFTKDLVVEWGHVPDDLSRCILRNTRWYSLRNLGLALDLFWSLHFQFPYGGYLILGHGIRTCHPIWRWLCPLRKSPLRQATGEAKWKD